MAALPEKAPDTEATRRVAEALAGHGMDSRLTVLEDTARSAEDAAKALGVGVEAIVKTLIFDYAPEQGPMAGQLVPLAVLVSGDRQCDVAAIPGILGTGGKVSRPDADRVKEVTGYSIGGVSPAGLPEDVEVLIDAELERSETVWAAAGHTHLVFGCGVGELERISGGRVSADVGVGP